MVYLLEQRGRYYDTRKRGEQDRQNIQSIAGCAAVISASSGWGTDTKARSLQISKVAPECVFAQQP